MQKSDTHKTYGIIGESLAHTLSPEIHNYLFNRFGLDCTYTTFEINPTDLRGTVSGIRALGISGVNITFPYKNKVLKYLDKIDASAHDTGAANTIINRRGILTGYNTDTYGIKTTLTDRLKFNPHGKNIIILGSGGAARACVMAIARFSARSIIIMNRNPHNASLLITSLSKRNSTIARSIKAVTNLRTFKNNYHADLIINATSADKGYINKKLASMSRVGIIKDTIFFDLNYGDRALSKNLPKGINKAVDGLYMLMAQAAESFQIWTSIEVSPLVIYNYINRKLKGNQ
jgi:shikimate dehydrogenase